MEPELAALERLKVPVEPRAAAVELAAAPAEPIVAPVDKGSSPLEAPEALSFSWGLAFFFPSGATRIPHINDAWICSIFSRLCIARSKI